MPALTLLCWDIDGTLLTTARAGVYAFEAAVEEVCGTACDLQGMRTAGMTDHEVAELAVETAGCEPDPALVERVLRAYERNLPAALPRRRGRVLPGVREALEDLAPRPGVESVLLTGNTRAGAAAKLGHYGLGPFFPHGGAFCQGPGTREEIAARVLDVARALGASGGALDVVVIGDTPRDIACGEAIGARTLAVASGAHTAEELAEHDPWLVVERIPEPERFRRLLGV
ncbi:MAG TPA: HAD family hydrolase [Planctomycetota bacterium]|nr:HAD family hydrolase [Planctomycetota bacterium]